MTDKIYLAIYEQCKDDLVEFDFWLSNSGLSEATKNRCRNKLKKLGLIQDLLIDDVYEAKKLTLKYSNTGKVCEWCGHKSYILHKHHFPVPKSMGGTEIVEICPNCHSTFHSIYKGGNV